MGRRFDPDRAHSLLQHIFNSSSSVPVSTLIFGAALYTRTSEKQRAISLRVANLSSRVSRVTTCLPGPFYVAVLLGSYYDDVVNLRQRFLAICSLALLFASVSIQVANAATGINNVKLDFKNPKVGQTITWTVDADCGAEQVIQIFVSVKDPLGTSRMMQNSANVMDMKMGKTVARGTFTIPLKITSEANPGLYNVDRVTLNCSKSGNYDWTQGVDQISFEVQDTGQISSKNQPQLEKLVLLNQGEVKADDVVKLNLVANGPGKLNTVSVALITPQGTEIRQYFTQYGQTPSGEASKKIDTTLQFTVDNDWQSGVYRVSRVDIDGYQGIDLSNAASPDDPNPGNTTSSFERRVSISASPGKGQQVSGSPISGAVTQPDISLISFTVNNPNAVTPAPPVVSNLSLSSTEVSAGNTFSLQMDVDGAGAYISTVYANFTDVENQSNSFTCNQLNRASADLFPTKYEKLNLTCQTTRLLTPGTYRISNVLAQTTSCKVSLSTYGNAENQGCQSPPKVRSINYVYQNYYQTVYSQPTVKQTPVNILDGKQTVAITAAAPLTKPVYVTPVITSDKVVVRYPTDYTTTCQFSANQGSVAQTTTDKSFLTVTISGLKAKSTVNLSGTCTAQDKAKVSFVDSFTTTLPKPPVLPSVISQKADIDSVLISLSDLDQDGIDYDVEVSAGSFIIAGDTLEITDLEPGESSILTMTMTDEFGQVTTGVVGTFTSQEPPKLYAPVVTVVKSSKGNYTFTFKRLKELTYSVKATNCTSKLSADNIFISNLIPGKLATAYLNVSDKYGQKVSVKFLTASVKK